jgi:hypothetical protein
MKLCTLVNELCRNQKTVIVGPKGRSPDQLVDGHRQILPYLFACVLYFLTNREENFSTALSQAETGQSV